MHIAPNLLVQIRSASMFFSKKKIRPLGLELVPEPSPIPCRFRNWGPNLARISILPEPTHDSTRPNPKLVAHHGPMELHPQYAKIRTRKSRNIFVPLSMGRSAPTLGPPNTGKSLINFFLINFIEFMCIDFRSSCDLTARA